MGLLFKRDKSRPPVRLASLTAGGSSYGISDYTDYTKISLLRQNWQQRAYEIYDAEGHLFYATNYIGGACARVQLVGATKPKNHGELEQPTILTEGPVADAIAGIESPLGGQSGFLRQIGRNIFLTGESWIIASTVTYPDGSIATNWDAVSVDELVAEGGSQMRRRLPGGQPEKLPPGAVTFRIWKEHPRYSELADAGTRSCMELLEKIIILNRAEKAVARSQLAGSGILALPQELVPPAWQNQMNDPNPMASNPLWEAVAESMTAPLRDESAPSAVVPLLLVGPGEIIKNMRYEPLDRKFDSGAAASSIKMAIEQIANTLELPKEILLGVGEATHWCVDTDTEILTPRGWVTEDQLVDGDVVLTLNTETGLSEWQRVLDIARFEVKDLDMFRMKGKLHDSLSTMNHRWPVKNQKNEIVWRTSETLCVTDKIMNAVSAASYPVEPKHSDALVDAVAWYYTEGTLNRYRGITIGQSHRSNPIETEMIRSCLTDLFGPETTEYMNRGPRSVPRWNSTVEEYRGMTIFHINVAASREILQFVPTADKVVDMGFIHELTRQQMERFIDISVLADGSHNTNSRVMGQKNTERLNAVRLAAYLSGTPVHEYSRISGGFKPGEVQNLITFMDERNSSVSARDDIRSVEKYTGTIWCPVTANQTWYARRGGSTFFTGNTAWAIREDVFQAHIQPLIELICAGLTRTFLKKALAKFTDAELKANGIDNRDDVIVWYDASQLVIQPDKGDKMLGLHDRFIVNDAAVARELGVKKEDILDPASDEYARRVGIKMADPGMAVTGKPTPPPTPAGPAGGGSGGPKA